MNAPAPVLEIAHDTFVRAAQAALAALGKNAAAPSSIVLQGAHFDGAYLYATDRYIAARVELPARGKLADDRNVLGDSFFIPRDALAWIAASKIARARRVPLATMSDGGFTIRVSLDGDKVRVSVRDMFDRTDPVTGAEQVFEAEQPTSYPPVERLWSSWTPPTEPVAGRLDAVLLTRIVSYAAKHPGKETWVQVELGAPKRALNGAVGSPGTVRVETADASFLVAQTSQGM